MKEAQLDFATWPTTVHLGLIDFTATSPHPRTVRDSLADGPLVHLRCVSCAQSLGATSHPRAHSSARTLHLPSTPLLSLSLAKPWRSSPSSTLTIEAPPRRSTTGGHRRTTPTSCTTPISSSSLGRSFPPTSSSSTPSPPSSPKQGRRPRATPSLPRRLEAIAGILLDAGECFSSPIHPPLS